jgi:hypothetical protein
MKEGIAQYFLFHLIYDGIQIWHFAISNKNKNIFTISIEKE